jgi:eukaryotic-like serine/threonine-protein kinase
MSPEQLMGEKGVDFRSDLWSLGVLAFEALTGERPFGGGTMGALTMQVHSETRPRPSQKNPTLPRAVDEWFAKACARDPAARFAGAKELAAALATALGQEVPHGIALEQSGPRGEQMGLADTAEASSHRRPSDRGTRDGVSAPPQISPTGAGLSSTGGTAKRDSAWRLMLIVAVVALGIGVLATRAIGRHGEGTAPGSSGADVSPPLSSAPPAVTVAMPPIETRDAWVAPAPTSAQQAASAEAPGSLAPPTRRPPPSSSTANANAHRLAPPRASATPAVPAPATSSERAERPQGSDDDIR